MVKRIVALGVVLIMCLSCASCLSGRHEIYEDGFFEYIIVGENSRFLKKGEDGVIAIVGLTESGKEQEVIDFPRTIDGKVVQRLGYGRKHNGCMGGGGNYLLESPNLKKVFIHDNISRIETEAFYLLENISIMLCIASDYLIDEIAQATAYQGTVYMYVQLFEASDEVYQTDGVSFLRGQRVCPANITFLNNYSDEINQGYYRLDNIETGEKIPLPPAPERDGYNFTGWFTEPDCLNLWNFDTVAEITENTEFKLYAGWRII